MAKLRTNYRLRILLWTSAVIVVLSLAWLKREELAWGSVPNYLPGVGFVLAGLGLNTWQKQLQGTHDFELARRTLKALYATRDAIRGVRRPFMELHEAGEQAKKSDQPWQAAAYQRRWDGVNEASRELDVALLEVEAVWGSLLKKERTELRGQLGKLLIATRNYLSTFDKENKGEVSLYTKEDRDILYEISVEDTYNLELEAILKKFESKLRPKLGRKRT